MIPLEFFKYLLGVLGIGAINTSQEMAKDSYGLNGTDREYVQRLNQAVQDGEITSEEAKSRLSSKGLPADEIMKAYGEPTASDEFYSGKNSFLDNIAAKYFGAGLTDAEKQSFMFNRQERIAAQEFNSAEAQKSRDFTMYMAQNKYGMETASMQAAGVNPAMVYGNGNLVPTAANSAQASVVPASAPGIGHATLSDFISPLMSLARLPLELEKLQSEIDKNRGETEQIGVSIQKLKTDIEGSNLDNEAKRITNSWLDAQQYADWRLKNMSADEKAAAIDKYNAEIEKMSYEELTMVINWYDTLEHIQYLQSLQSLNDAQIRELAALTRKADNEAALIKKEVDNFDDITVIGSVSTNTKTGPFSVGESRPMTLADRKRNAEKLRDEKAREGKDRSWRDIKDQYPE